MLGRHKENEKQDECYGTTGFSNNVPGTFINSHFLTLTGLLAMIKCSICS